MSSAGRTRSALVLDGFESVAEGVNLNGERFHQRSRTVRLHSQRHADTAAPYRCRHLGLGLRTYVSEHVHWQLLRTFRHLRAHDRQGAGRKVDERDSISRCINLGKRRIPSSCLYREKAVLGPLSLVSCPVKELQRYPRRSWMFRGNPRHCSVMCTKTGRRTSQNSRNVPDSGRGLDSERNHARAIPTYPLTISSTFTRCAERRGRHRSVSRLFEF